MSKQNIQIVAHVVSLRKTVCPRTSYATSGTAGSVLCAFGAVDQLSKFEPLFKLLRSSGEFEQVLCADSLESLARNVNGHVILVCGDLTADGANTIDALFKAGKSKLAFSLGPKGTKLNPAEEVDPSLRERFSLLEHAFGAYRVLTLEKGKETEETKEKEQKATGFNGQPSVQSGKQFQYLWTRTTPQIEFGKDRVLQRLADRNVFSSRNSNAKLTAQQWDKLVQQAIDGGGGDYGVYSMIREKVLGHSLEHDLRQADAPAVEEEGDGRANHMVSRTIDSVPLSLRTGSTSMLDYGCAEGAITAALGKQLGLSPDQIIGADVRNIPSVGFTFVPLAAEDDAVAPAVGSILPSIPDGSVDLVTSAMVFHHVTHIKSVLLELRRIVSARGALVIREHHCTSADMGAFLDITHGLYSLSWSSPVEWPDFIPEYKASYRSREEWDALMKECGFSLSLETCGPQGVSNYRAAEAKRKPNGYFPNVIKAYYATYVPNPEFRVPGANVESSSEVIRVRPVVAVEEVKKAPGNSIHDGVMYESNKHPNKFYRVNAITGATEWSDRVI